MANLSSRISMQLRRFLLIQNALEDALGSDTEILTRHLINTRLEVLELNWTKFQNEHDNLYHDVPEEVEDQSYIKTRTYERCQEFYVQARAALLVRQEAVESANPSSRASGSSAPIMHTTTHRRTLPRIEIPKFSGDYSSWRSFRDLFASMVGNDTGLSNVEKMHYLKTSLSGDAAKLVINLPVTDDTFSIAWEALTSRYENKRILISSQLDKIFALKPMQGKSARELNSLISTVSESIGALKALGCHTDSWDPLLIHKLSRLLDADTREAWEVKLGSSSAYPTFKEFEDFLIGKTRAWESLESNATGSTSGKYRSLRSSGKVETRSRSLMALTSNTKELTCRLCKSGHLLSACPDFVAMSIQRRRRLIIKLNLCFNCFGSHAVNRCSNIKRCKKCGHKHHTAIHESFNKQKQVSSPNDPKTQKSETVTAALPSTSKAD